MLNEKSSDSVRFLFGRSSWFLKSIISIVLSCRLLVGSFVLHHTNLNGDISVQKVNSFRKSSDREHPCNCSQWEAALGGWFLQPRQHYCTIRRCLHSPNLSPPSIGLGKRNLNRLILQNLVGLELCSSNQLQLAVRSDPSLRVSYLGQEKEGWFGGKTGWFARNQLKPCLSFESRLLGH